MVVEYVHFVVTLVNVVEDDMGEQKCLDLNVFRTALFNFIL